MRQTAARLNRAWLTVLGALLLLGGLLIIVIGAGLLDPLARAVGLSLTGPGPQNRLFGAATTTALGITWVVVVMAAIGVLVALLGLAWLLAQIPRSNEAKAFRLHDDAADGLTRCAPSVVSDAVEAEIGAIPGVSAAAAVLRGSAQEPDLTVKLTANDRTDLPRLLHTLQTTVAENVGGALDTQLTRLGVQIEIGTSKNKTDRIVV